jgi:hypothetical protein
LGCWRFERVGGLEGCRVGGLGDWVAGGLDG